MTVEITLIPDGSGVVPAEARDHDILAAHLEGAGIPDVLDTPLSGWRDVERTVYGDRSRTELRTGGEDDSLAGFPDAALDTITNAVVSNINGLKAHPDGWHNVEQV